MEIGNIQNSLFFTSFTSNSTSISQASINISAGDLFTISIAFYLSQLHQVVMQSWSQFAEAEQANAQEKNRTHKVRSQRQSEEEASRLIGQSRQMEQLLETPTDMILMQSVHRQAGKFRFYEGQQLSNGQHLYLPV